MPIQPIDTDTLQGPAAERLASMERRFGGVPLTARYLAHSVPALDGFFGMTTAAMQALEPRLREVLALFSAEYNDCSLCRAMHEQSARRVGLDDREIAAARRGESSDTREQAALDYVAEILDAGGRVSADVESTARAAGFDDQGLLELFLAATNNLMTNYFNRFAGLTAADFRAPAGEAA